MNRFTQLMIQRLLLVALCVLGTAAAAQEVYDNNGIKYCLDASNHTAEVVLKNKPEGRLPDANQYSGDIVIPSQITYNDEDYTVTTIGNWAFFKCPGITSIELPNTIKKIKAQAFYMCSGISELILPEGLEETEFGAFEGCEGIESLRIPNSMQKIDVFMCSKCTNLKYIDFQSSTPEIVMPQFSSDDKSLYQLTAFRVDDNNSKYSQIDGVLCNKAQTELILYPPAHGEHYSIPSSINTIKACSFMGCTLLKTVDIPNTVTSIEEEAFRESGLLSVIIPNSISVIEKLCFNNCPALQSVDLASVTTLKQEAFSYCKALNSIVFPTTLKTIGNSAFAQCGLTDLDIPSTVQEIGDYAFGDNFQLKTVQCAIPNENLGMFKGCSSLESADLSNSVVIPKNCFVNCKKLNSVTIDNHLKRICEGAFHFCSSLQEITLPDGLEYIGAVAFEESGLESIDIPNTVTTIMQGAFMQCRSLESVQLPNQLEILAPMIFARCELLESIEIPNSVKYFDDGTMGTQDPDGGGECGMQFMGCISLSSVILSNQLKNIPPRAFMLTAISEIEIPNSVEVIEWWAFRDVPLEHIELPFNLKRTPGMGSFGETELSYMKTYLLDPEPDNFMEWYDDEDATLYVPKGTTEIYEDEEMFDWCHFQNIVEATPVELEGEYTTFCSLDDLDFSEVEDLEAYVAVKQVNGTLTMRRVRRVAAGTGVVLKGTPGFYEIPYADETETIGTNLLVGINDGARIPATDGDKTNWLMDDEGDWAAADSSRLAFHHAYLQLPADAEGVTEVKWVDNASYDLTGDGQVDITDVNLIINIILDKEDGEGIPVDIDGDGSVDIADVNALINIILEQ